MEGNWGNQFLWGLSRTFVSHFYVFIGIQMHVICVSNASNHMFSAFKSCSNSFACLLQYVLNVP